MTDNERANFYKGAVSRAPGKRQIKPSVALLYEITDEAAICTDNDDMEFTDGNNCDSDSESGSESDSVQTDQNIFEVSETVDSNIILTNKDGIDLIQQSNNIEFPTMNICSVCLNLRVSDFLGEMIQCDKCGLVVHELCYGVNSINELTNANNVGVDAQSMSSSISTEPWFCEPCLLGNGIMPHCELCPNICGAFKRADIRGCWVHMICALYTPEIVFLDREHMSNVNWQGIDYRNFGRKPCVGCTDKLEARTGITVRCDAGLCKNYYHITCAQRLGLLITNTRNHLNIFHTPMEAGYLHCKRHNQNEAEVISQKNAYSKFICQEDYRIAVFKNRQLDLRHEKKWNILHKDLLDQIKQFEEEKQSSTQAQASQKKSKFIHTNSKFINAFAEKAELLGMSRQQFEDEFSNVFAANLPINLSPAFSKHFFGYVEYRDRFFINEQEDLLIVSCQQRDRLLADQRNMEQELINLKEINTKLNNKYSTQKKVFERFKTIIETYSPNLYEKNESRKKRNQKRLHSIKTHEIINSLSNNKKASISKFYTFNNASCSKTSFNLQSFSGKFLSLTEPEQHSYFSIPNTLFSKFGFSDSKSQKMLPSTKKQLPISMTTEYINKYDNELALKFPASANTVSTVEQVAIECRKCNKTSDPHLLIFCETCKQHYHIGCLDPPLARMPTKNKFLRFECSDCACPSDNDDIGNIEESHNIREEHSTMHDWTLTTKRVQRCRKRL